MSGRRSRNSGSPSPGARPAALRALPLAILLAAVWVPAAAYIRISTSSTDARPVKWDLAETTLALPNVANGEVIYQINPAGSDNIAGNSEIVATEAAFRHWEAIQRSNIAFGRGPDSSLLEASNDGINLVYWAEGSKTPVLGNKSFRVEGFVGLTVIVNDTTGPTAGLLRNADIILNGNELSWTTDPVANPASYDVEAVLTHEAGHVLGLEHTPVVAATMYGRQSPGLIHKVSFSADDIFGASQIYPAGDQLLVGAEQRGTIQNGLGGRILGAVVNTCDANGNLLSGTISDPNGIYSSAGIAAGPGTTYLQPLDDPAASFSTLFDETDLGGVWDSTIVNNFVSTNTTGVTLTAGMSTVQNFIVGSTPHSVHVSAIGQRALTPAGVVFSTRPAQLFTGDTNVYVGISGPGISNLQAFEILGTGVTVNGVAASGSANGEPAVVYDVSVDPNAATGARSMRIQTAGQRVYATGGVEILRDPLVTGGVVEMPATIPGELDPGLPPDSGIEISLEGQGVRLTWMGDAQATEYDVYHGNLTTLFTTNTYAHSGLAAANGSCGIFETTFLFPTDGGDTNAWYYLVRGRNRLGKGSLGPDFFGSPRPDGTPPCP